MSVAIIRCVLPARGKRTCPPGELGKKANGWNIPPETMGRAGLSDDFVLRASLQCLGGIVAKDPAEAVYFNTTIDVTGEVLDAAKCYTLRFPPG